MIGKYLHGVTSQNILLLLKHHLLASVWYPATARLLPWFCGDAVLPTSAECHRTAFQTPHLECRTFPQDCSLLNQCDVGLMLFMLITVSMRMTNRRSIFLLMVLEATLSPRHAVPACVLPTFFVVAIQVSHFHEDEISGCGVLCCDTVIQHSRLPMY
jgi:hypothetical protein